MSVCVYICMYVCVGKVEGWLVGTCWAVLCVMCGPWLCGCGYVVMWL